jgi:nicotinate-nucleotide pyrophosphorylase (carboxylating)
VDAAREALSGSEKRAATSREQREPSDHVRIACTRKTTPGLRGIEKRAVVAGGGDTHRLDLSHMVMVKDNHVAEMGLASAVAHFRERASFTTQIEVEVEEPVDAPRAAEAGADVVLLDNMRPDETEHAVGLLRAEDTDVLAEASGDITVADVPDYAGTGVDVISMGSLTHSAETLDYSFRTG